MFAESGSLWPQEEGNLAAFFINEAYSAALWRDLVELKSFFAILKTDAENRCKRRSCNGKR